MNKAPEERIYHVLTSRQHRCGPKTPERTRAVLENIKAQLERGGPLQVLQFWGGAKNPNFPQREVDGCELQSLRHLFKIHQEVSEIHPEGISYTISSGDERVEFANNVPREWTQTYQESFLEMAESDEFEGVFSIEPVSKLYLENPEFKAILKGVYEEVVAIRQSMMVLTRLTRDAANNVLGSGDKVSEEEALEAATRYMAVMAAEERAKIYEKYKNFLRSFFIKFSQDYREIYRRLLPNFEDPFLASNQAVYLYTGYKGNIMQPWQSVSKEEDGKIHFLGQNKYREETV